MMNREHQEHGLITRILDLLGILQKEGLELDHLYEAGEQTGLLDSQSVQTAFEIIQFMDEMPGGFLIYYAEQDERIIYANKGLLRIFQCDTLGEFRTLTGNSFRGLVYPDDLEAVEASIQAQIAGSQYDLDYVEYRARRRDGSIIRIEDYGHFIRNQTVGNIFYVFLGDATEKCKRLMSERALLINEKNEKEQTLQKLIREYDRERADINQEYLRRLEIIEGLSVNYDSILYADLDRNQILPYRLGRRSRSIFDEMYQVRPFDQCLTAYRDTWVCGDDQALFTQAIDPDYIRRELSEHTNYYINYRAVAEEETQYVQMRVVHVGHDPHVSQIVLGFRTVDEEVRREMEHRQVLAEALENANLANTAKNTFLSNVSHDMRTPLNAIFGFTALAKLEIQNTGAVQYYLERIETSSRQLLDLINKVLELSHTESGRAHLIETECSLSKVIQEIYDFLEPQAEEKNLLFTLDCSKLRHPDVYTDPERLKQLSLYLINNAITYTESGGVSITFSEREELPNQYAVYQLTVADTGIGISQEFLDRIFEPFAREKNTTLSGIHGIGLGLSIAKNIVDMMNGTIDVKSTVGEGSAFTVTLRLRFQNQAAASIDQLSGEDRVLPRKILLVEDNEINLELETELLQEMDFEVETATDGSIAVDRISHSQPGDFDLILMDIQMPTMDGWTAASEIRKLDNPALARIPIIALSANVFESDIRKSAECGIDVHLPKPMDLNLLLKAMEELEKKRRSQQSNP